MKQGDLQSLPKGWEIKKFSQLFDVKSSKRVHQSDWKSSGIPFYRAREVVKLARDGNVSNELFISQELYDEFTKEKGAPKTGDFIVSSVGTLGQCYLVKDFDKFYFKDASVLWFENLGKVNSRYIEDAFKSDIIMTQVMDGSMGATVGTLTISRAKNIEIPIPPLPEQQRIVAILDEAFAAIAKAKANAEQNLKNAKELFESYLQSVFENKGEGWDENKLGELIEIKNGRNQKEVLSETGKYKIMGSAGNVMGYATDFICEAGSTIIGRKGNISTPIYIDERFWNVDTAFGFYPKNKSELDKRFVYYICLGIDFKSMNRGTTIPSLVKTELQTIQISYPKSLKTQQDIVQKLDDLSAETKKLEAIYQTKINNLEELKKSILQKAFNGKLSEVVKI